jgi:AGCS family alanine or glycine:cation symporter
VQGLYGILEVFLDTGVICTLTALAILLSVGVPTGDAGVSITADALACVFGSASAPILSVAVLCFAYATVITWAYYGERCCLYLFRSPRAGRVFSVIFCASLILGAVAAPTLVWELADLVVSLMTLINCAVLLYLWREIREQTRQILE